MGSTPNANSPFVQIIQEAYNVQVMFRNRPKLQPTLVMVKGCEKDVERVKEATTKLIEHMCGSLAVSIIVLSNFLDLAGRSATSWQRRY